MKRLPFLDWTRGVAVVVMIQCHVFNSFLRVDLRRSDAYIVSQYIGGIAAVLFLFLAGLTLAFQMDRLETLEPHRGRRVIAALRRAGYIFVLAFLFRFSNWVLSIPLSPWQTMSKVDILNAMALAMAVLSVAAALSGAARARFAAAAGIAIAFVSPVVNLAAAPEPLRSYFEPRYGTFAFFPWAAYLAFGIAIGSILKRTAADSMDRLQQWCALTGFGLIAFGQYASNLPYSLYAHSEFWLNSPALIVIRTGVVLVLMAAAYLWTGHVAGPGWSWLQALGKTSLMAYWVHVLLVYGSVAYPLKKALTIPETALAAAAMTSAMLGLAAAKLHWSARRKPQKAVVPAAAPCPDVHEDELEPVS